MAMTARIRFILMTSTAFAVFSLVWIFLSDQLLVNFADVETIQDLSTAKGVFYVAISTAMFYLALRAVPAAEETGANSLGNAFSMNLDDHRGLHWVSYFFAIALPVSLLAARAAMSLDLHDRPMLIVLMLPIIVSAMLGGFWPGVLATVISALGSAYFTMPPTNSFSIARDIDLLLWSFLIGNGLAVSVLSELLRRTLTRANAQRHLLDAVVSGTPDAVFVKDALGRYKLINEAGATMIGKATHDIIGHDDNDLFPPESAAVLVSNDRAVMEAGQVRTHEQMLKMSDGRALVFQVTKGPVRDEQGRVSGLFGISRDVTERRAAELAQMEAATVFVSSYEGIMVVSPDLRITRVNPAFTRITGYGAEEVLGRSPSLLSSGLHGRDFYDEIWATIRQHGVWRGEITNKRKNGELYPEMLSISVALDSHGDVQHYIGVFWDISHLKAHEAELERIAHYDPLTGSPNRRLLTERLDLALARANQTHKSLAVCFLDLDGFKAINDEHGHVVGDQFLVHVSQNLTHILRADDTLARLGGDEFVMLLSDIANLQEAEQLLARVLATVSRPVDMGSAVVNVSASMGVSLYPQDLVDTDTLLRHADQAMYIAKEAGRNRYHLFDPESDRKAQQHRLFMAELRDALAHNEFVLHYQPKVDLSSGEIVGVEALARWQSPTRGLLPPAQFLPEMDGHTLEKPFGEWVIQTALAQAARWQAEGNGVRVSVNVSAYHLLQSDFYSQLQQALAQQPTVPPSHFELEVLETAAIRDMDMAVAVMRQCRELGVHFSLDDFGTGYSSLTYLRKLPVDLLKIDQSFVRGMLDNPDDLGIVQGVIQLARSFNRQVIAEGVETLAHGAALQKLGCQLAQGYGIAKPMPPEQLAAWCQQWQAEQRWLQVSP